FIAYSRADYPEYHEMFAALFKKLDRLPQIAEEHDSSTSLIAAVEAGRGVALVPESLSCLAGERLKLRALSPAPAPLSRALLFRDSGTSAVTQKFITAAKAANQK